MKIPSKFTIGEKVGCWGEGNNIYIQFQILVPIWTVHFYLLAITPLLMVVGTKYHSYVKLNMPYQKVSGLFNLRTGENENLQ
jgi:hypothetical protein